MYLTLSLNSNIYFYIYFWHILYVLAYLNKVFLQIKSSDLTSIVPI
jgi:hypothetical protein